MWLRILLILLLVLNCFMLYEFLWGENSLNQYLQLKARKSELKADVNQTKQENVELSKQIRSLNNDSEYLKKVIRSKMNLLRLNEVIYIQTNSSVDK